MNRKQIEFYNVYIIVDEIALVVKEGYLLEIILKNGYKHRHSFDSHVECSSIYDRIKKALDESQAEK